MKTFVILQRWSYTGCFSNGNLPTAQ